jgi:hypothetical protein
MKLSISRRILAGIIVVLIGIGVLGIVLGREQARRALETRKEQLITAGEKLLIGELAPVISTEGQGAAVALVQASWRLRNGELLPGREPEAMRFVGAGRARVLWREAECVAEVPGSWAVLAEDLEVNKELLQTVREILKVPELGTQLNYHEGFSLHLPHLARMKPIAHRLAAAALLDLHLGRMQSAHSNVEALGGMDRVLRHEPLIISQLVRNSVAAIALSVTWEWLQADGLSDEELEVIQSGWEEIHLMQGMRRAMAMERAIAVEMFRQLRRSPTMREQLLNDLWNSAPGPSVLAGGSGTFGGVAGYASDLGLQGVATVRSVVHRRLWLWRWSFLDELRYLDVSGKAIRVADRVGVGVPFGVAQREFVGALTDLWDTAAAEDNRFAVTRLCLPDLDKLLTRIVRGEALRGLVVTALAIKRYELREGELPPDLESLVPSFLSAVPTDVMDGEPLRYRREEGGFLLYSVGEDGVDDGGDARPVDQRMIAPGLGTGRDIVWPVASLE